jgi:hypothetical protein
VQHIILTAAVKSGRLHYTEKYTPRLWLTMISHLSRRGFVVRVGAACFLTEQGRLALQTAKVKDHPDTRRRTKAASARTMRPAPTDAQLLPT